MSNYSIHALAQHPVHPSIVLRHGRIGLPKNKGPIRTVKDLAQHLQSALAVELSTIPLYLTGQWTVPNIDGPKFPEYPQFKSKKLPALIMHVAKEEMLHLCLVGNALRGIRSFPILYDKSVIPEYPTNMLGRVPPLELHIRPATQENIQTFVDVETPEKKGSPAQPDDYETLGQFYKAIEEGFQYLAANDPNLFDQASAAFQFPPDPKPIYRPDTPGAGGIVQVLNIDSAMVALQEIVVQGEGDEDQFPGFKLPEPPHYQIFKKLRDPTQTPPWTVKINIVTDPKTSTYQDPKILKLSSTFDAAYCLLLITLQVLWRENNSTNRDNILDGNFWPIMTQVLGPLSDILMRQPVGNGEFAAACFNYYEFNHDSSATQQFQNQLQATIDVFEGTDKADLVTIQDAVKNLVDMPVPT